MAELSPLGSDRARSFDKLGELRRLLAAIVAPGDVDPVFAASIDAVIDQASDWTLMHDGSKLVGKSAGPLGAPWLRGLCWAAQFDPSDADQCKRVNFAAVGQSSDTRDFR